jgi:Gas vesicle protein K
MTERRPVGQRWETDAAGIRRDLGRLVLTIVELLRQLMERQALRRVDSGTLSDAQIEELGLALMRLEQAMTELREHFGLAPGELNLDLGPLGPLLTPDPAPEGSGDLGELAFGALQCPPGDFLDVLLGVPGPPGQ